MKKEEWDNIKIDTFKEHIIVYQRSRGKFGGRNRPANYQEILVPKYSMKFGNYLEVGENTKYSYRRIKEIKEI